MNKLLYSISTILFCLFFSSVAGAAINGDTKLRPFTLAQEVNGAKLADVTQQVRNKLLSAGYQVIGSYSPYDTANILIVTTNGLKKVAAASEHGGFGAVFRVAITQVNKQLQVTHNNPNYYALAYHLKSDLSDLKASLKQTLGFVRDFGGGEGIKASDLPGYNYTFGMEKFGHTFEFASYPSYQQAIAKVEAGLASGKQGITKVYRIDIPGKQQTVFGLSLQADVNTQPYLNDKFVMDVIDPTSPRRTAHLPYEIMVDGKNVIAMHPHFRLAVNFPELKMFGKNSFGKIMDLPYVYEEFFTKAVGGKWPPPAQEW